MKPNSSKSICFFQSSRLEPLASLMAARLEASATIVELDVFDEELSPPAAAAPPNPDYRATLDALFRADSVQSW